MGYTLTYNQLIAEVQTIVESTNEELVAELPKIIARAHDQVQRDLALSMWNETVETAMTANNPVLVRNALWLKVLSIFIPSQNRFVEQRSSDYVRSYAAAVGVPKFWYQKSEGVIFLGPTPALNYATQVEALVRIPHLAPDRQVTWISTNAADLLLLQTLIGSESYLVGPERVAEFTAMYRYNLGAALEELRGMKRTEYEPIREAPKPAVSAAA